MRTSTLNILLLASAFLLSSCAPKRSNDAARIDSLRIQAEGLIKAQSLMGWNSWAFGTPSNQDSLYRANANLFTLEQIALVRKAESEEPDSTQKKRLRYLRRYLTTEFTGKETAPLDDQVSNMQSEATVMFEGKEIPYRQVNSLIVNERDQKRRARLFIALDPTLDSLNIVLRQIELKNRVLARQLGYVSYNAMAEDLLGFSLEEFAQLLNNVLAMTESTYTDLLREIAQKQLRLTTERLFRYDLGALSRIQQFDRFFPGSSMVDAVKGTYKGLGIDLDAQRNLRIDAEAREKKNPRAACFPTDIPNDIRLSIKPVGGFYDYRALFHEMGHALHYALTTEHAFEFKYLGEGTVTENFAFLSEYLLTNQAWLRLRKTMPTVTQKEFLRLQALFRLQLLRRYCAKFLYEVQLHSGASNPSTLYSSILSKATGYTPIPSDEKRYLVDVDRMYYSASYLRAWFLEAQLNAKLTKDFGTNWFERSEAGAYMRSLWGRGDRFDGNELARQLGYEKISPEVLWQEIRMMILFSTK